jgi:predicted RNA binding protein YcfA (HicA-like mRNA interferase family)
LNGQQVISALEKAGFATIRIRSSRHFMRHPDGRTTVVPVHVGEIIGPGLMSKILGGAELKRDEFASLL